MIFQGHWQLHTGKSANILEMVQDRDVTTRDH